MYFIVWGFSHQGPSYSRHQVQSQCSMAVGCWWSGFLTGLSRTCVLPGFSSQWPRLGPTCFHLQLAFSLFASLFLITFLSDWFSCMEDITPSFSGYWHASSLLAAPKSHSLSVPFQAHISLEKVGTQFPLLWSLYCMNQPLLTRHLVNSTLVRCGCATRGCLYMWLCSCFS